MDVLSLIIAVIAVSAFMRTGIRALKHPVQAPGSTTDSVRGRTAML